MIDIHSHILPGIDDGARTLDDSVAIVRDLLSQGVTDVIATPHYVDETIYVSPKADNVALLDQLRERLSADGVSMNVYLGNEIYINDKIPELLESGVLSCLSDSKYLLVELPLNDEFQDYESVLADLIERGYQVILAHPERYAITQEDYSLITDLCDAGVLMQCNIGSILGKYGKAAQKLVKRLAKDKLIFTFASDIHHASHSGFIMNARKKLLKYYDEKELEKLLVDNPRKIITATSEGDSSN